MCTHGHAHVLFNWKNWRKRWLIHKKIYIRNNQKYHGLVWYFKRNLVIKLAEQCNSTFDPVRRRFPCTHEYGQNIITGMASGRKNSTTFWGFIQRADITVVNSQKRFVCGFNPNDWHDIPKSFGVRFTQTRTERE